MENLLAPKLDQMQTDLKSFVERHLGKSAELDARLRQLEQAFVSGPGSRGGPMGFGGAKSLGQIVAENEGFQAFKKGGRTSGQIEIGSFARKAVVITSGSWSAAPDYIPTMALPAQPRLPLRSVLPSFGTVSNMIEFPRETARSGSPDYAPEGSDKAFGDFTYTLIQCPIATLAFWIACSKQVIDDSAALSAYIDQRLIYLLEAKVEHELLFGDGASGHINGLCTQATPATGAPTNLIDASAAALAQLAALGYNGDFICCNPVDWWQTRTLKAVGSGIYLVGSPLDAQAPTLWGMAVSLSPSMPVGKFIVGVRNQAAIGDRQSATLELSREHLDYFTKNLVALLAEERLTLVVYQPQAFVFGQLAATGS